ncbi:DUF1028 domain-containing protein [Bosea sp. LjRoot9]|uniref:DUF1028 domain-containing protein n=1 Tax=Bosea sp. LjRoot9 TaxID=3342341 RepID=UPI003ECF3A6C
MTYSIAGMCRRTGMFGLAVTTSSIAVGSRCPFAKAGVGAVLTQHCTDPRLGPRGIALLEEGKTAAEAIATLTDAGPEIEHRQLAIIDRHGGTAWFHGKRILSTHHASQADGCVAIGNIIRTPSVVSAMTETFASLPDAHLGERLMAALEAGYEAGGELKQEKSAALLVVHEETFPLVDLRVDYDRAAIAQLRFLWENYTPVMASYVERALDPEASKYWVK